MTSVVAHGLGGGRAIEMLNNKWGWTMQLLGLYNVYMICKRDLDVTFLWYTMCA